MSANEAVIELVDPARRRGWLAGVAPGILLTALIAAASIGLHQVPGLGGMSPLILSILLGMALHNLVGTPARAKAGVAFALRRILRAAIVLLGLQLTLGQIASVGVAGVAATILTLAATFVFTLHAGRRLGVERQLTTLIAAGTSICGASAVVAANAVVDGGDEDVAYAVATVTVFGSLSMVLFPLFNTGLHLAPHAYGLWTGATIHEIAQVVAAAYQDGHAAGDFGTIVKLTRVMMLAPVVLLLAFFWRGKAGKGGAPPQGGHALVRARLPADGRAEQCPAALRRTAWTRRRCHDLPAGHGAGRHGPRNGRPQAEGEGPAPAGARRLGLGVHHRLRSGDGDARHVMLGA